MNKIDVLTLGDGSQIGIEVSMPPGKTNEVLVSNRADKRTVAFGEAVQRIRPLANTLLGTLRDLTETPKTVEVKFGLKLSADIGVFIAGGSTEGNFEVTLTWERDTPPATG